MSFTQQKFSFFSHKIENLKIYYNEHFSYVLPYMHVHVHVHVCVYYLHKINVIAMTKVLGIQNQRLTQCRYAKVILQSELPLQVDGEAWI